VKSFRQPWEFPFPKEEDKEDDKDEDDKDEDYKEGDEEEDGVVVVGV
jgi:hypothetical protein